MKNKKRFAISEQTNLGSFFLVKSHASPCLTADLQGWTLWLRDHVPRWLGLPCPCPRVGKGTDPGVSGITFAAGSGLLLAASARWEWLWRGPDLLGPKPRKALSTGYPSATGPVEG